mgnify:FL=1
MVEKKGEGDEYGNEDDTKTEIDKIMQGAVDPEQSKGQERELIELMSQKAEIDQ